MRDAQPKREIDQLDDKPLTSRSRITRCRDASDATVAARNIKENEHLAAQLATVLLSAD